MPTKSGHYHLWRHKAAMAGFTLPRTSLVIGVPDLLWATHLPPLCHIQNLDCVLLLDIRRRGYSGEGPNAKDHRGKEAFSVVRHYW